VALRSGFTLPKTGQILKTLGEKHLISRYSIHGRRHYMAQQFVIGFWEAQVDHLDRNLVESFEEYLPAYADTGLWGKAPQLRVVPVQKSISLQNRILPYEKITAILDSHEKFAIANCICRQEQRILGKDCGKPIEACLVFDGGADYFAKTGRGRIISRDETDALVAQAEKTGLVLQPSNSKNPGNICMCCGCCCGVLRSLKMRHNPASEVSSDFHAQLNGSRCTGCKICLKRCQMDALSVVDGKAQLDLTRCIGCGLCVSTCKADALTLVRKRRLHLPRIPVNDIMMVIWMGQSHGQLGWGQILGILIRSGVDRIRAEFTFRNSSG
jgi:electron transport complex protein RnfB